MGFKPSEAEPDFWYRKTSNSFEYVAQYVDNIICFLKEPEKILQRLQQYYTLKAVGS